MPAPEELLKSLAGHPATLDQTLGCVTRIFHLCEGHPAFMGRRSSSTRIAIDSGQSQLRAQNATHTNRHDRRNPISTKKLLQPTSRHHKSYSDISDFAATPSRTFTEFRTSNEDTEPKHAYSEATRPAYSACSAPEPAFSEGTVDALAFYHYESLQAAATFTGDPRRCSDLDHRDSIKRSLRSPKRVSKAKPAHSDQTQQSSSSEIRDALLATFSANPSEQAFKREPESRHLPRSSALYARGLEPSELLHWKDGLRSTVSPPRRLTRDAKGNKSPSRSSGRTISHHSSPEKRVEPKSKDRGRSLSRDYNPLGAMSPKKLFGEAPGKESPGASDFRESLRPFLTAPIAPPRPSFASRLTDASGGQNQESRDTSVNVIARLMGLEENSRTSARVAHDVTSRGEKFFRGLVQFDPQMMRASSPPSPPPPCLSKKHHFERRYKQENHGLQEDQYQENYPAQYKMEHGLCCCEEDRDYEHLILSRRPFLPFEDDDVKEVTQHLEYVVKDSLPPKLDGDASHAEEAKLDTSEISPSPTKQSKQKKKMLRKILEAMRPKLLLKISRRKQEVSPLTNTAVQPIQEKQQQSTSVSFDSKSSTGADKEEPSRSSNFIKPLQEPQTESSTSADSSIIKSCIDETAIVVVKPVDKFLLSNDRSQVPNADIGQARQVETTSSNSNVKENCPSQTATQINNKDCNLAHDQGKSRNPIKSRVADASAPRSAHAELSLESDCETATTTQRDKADTVPESWKTRTPTMRLIPNTRSPAPDKQVKHGRASSPEARPSLPRSFLSKDHIRGARPVGSKSQLANGKKDDRPPHSQSKAQVAKEEILRRGANENSAASRLSGRSLENELVPRPVGKEPVSIKAPRANARSPGAVRLKHSNGGTEPLKALILEEEGANRPATANPVTSDVQILPALAQALPADSGPEMQQGQPNLGSFKEPLVCQLPELQQLERGDPCEAIAEISNSEACCAVPNEPQLLSQGTSTAGSEDVITPRGVRLNYEKLDDKLAESMDRPSPVSVLDTNCFDEDLPLSPTSSSKHNAGPMQDADSVAAHCDEYESCVKDVEAYQECPANSEADPDLHVLFNTCTEELQVPQTLNTTASEIGINQFQPTFQVAEPDEEKKIEEVSFSLPAKSTSAESHDTMPNPSTSAKVLTERQQTSRELPAGTGTINENLLQSLHCNGIFQENDHVLLLDCLEEIMERILESQSELRRWAGLPNETICETPQGKQLEHELWVEMQNVKRSSASSPDICDAVHNLLLTNLLRCQGRQWSNFNADREVIGLDMETMIVGELIEEAVGDLCALQCQKSRDALPLETTRRQLFAN